MVQTPSNMIPLGTNATDFNLPDSISGNMKSLKELKPDLSPLVMFICNHCPFVKHVQEQLVLLANDYQTKGVVFIAISSNDIKTHPEGRNSGNRGVSRRRWLPG